MEQTVEHGGLNESLVVLHHAPTEDESRRIQEHLEILLTDPLFVNSKRLPAFLRYVVKEALDGGPEAQIKERTLGIVAFGRSPDYDTNADPVVRMTAGEVRKKLAQFYYRNHTDVQIEVPLGSYVPRFRCAQAEVHAPVETASVPAAAAVVEVHEPPVVVASPVAAGRSVAKWPIAVVLLLLLGLGAGLAWRQQTARSNSVDHFWQTFADPTKQVLIVLPALTRTPEALPLYHFEAESVAIEDAKVATRLSNEFKMRGDSSDLALATHATLTDLRANPFVLIGAMDNVWTMRLSQSLPYAFERSDDRRFGRIVDRKDPKQVWTEDFSVPNSQIPQDYGIIARFRDATTEQPTVLVAGISAEGTLAAGEAVTTPKYLDMLLKAAGNAPNGFEAVIETKVIDGQSGPPTIVAVRSW